MATAEVDICNLALAHIGQAEITSLDENNKPARICKRFYPAARDDVLREHPWNFALKRVALPADVETPVFGFALQYTLPSDCLKPIEPEDLSIRWKVEARKILTDHAAPLNLRYIKKEADVSLYDPLFVIALALKVALMIGQPLTADTSLMQGLVGTYVGALRIARSADAQAGGTPDRPIEGDWLPRRGYGDDSAFPFFGEF